MQRPLLFSQSAVQFHFRRIRFTCKRSKKPSELLHAGICNNTSQGRFKRIMLFLKSGDQRMLVLDQLSVCMCAGWIQSGISIDCVRGWLATSQNSTDSDENCLQIDNIGNHSPTVDLILPIYAQCYIQMVLFTLWTCWWAIPTHLPPIMLTVFSPCVGFCDSFLLLMSIFCIVGFSLYWSFLV